MLNNFKVVTDSLMHHGLLQPTTHPNINNVGKAYSLLIELDREGTPRMIRFLEKEETGKLWRHSKGNHNSFPAIRVHKPLLTTSESEKIDGKVWGKAKRSGKIRLLDDLDYNSVNTECKEIRLSDWSKQQLGGVLESNIPELAALKQLLSVFPDTSKNTEFISKLLTVLRQKVMTCDNTAELDLIKELLVGTLDEKKGKYIAGCMTYYEIYETNDYPNLVATDATRKVLTALLNREMKEDSVANQQTTVSYLSGKPGEGISKYPSPNLPILGDTYFYSKKSDILCLTRYNMSGVNAFHANRDEVMAMNDAITFLTQESRHKKTWKAIGDCNHDKPDLLLAYLTEDPQNDALLAEMLGDPSDYEDEELYQEEYESRFETLCHQVLGDMKYVMEKEPMSRVNLMILETLDVGRKQVAYENFMTVEQFRNNLLSWSEAARNQPESNIRIRARKNKKKIVPYGVAYPGPNDICQLLKIHYTRSGMAKLMKQSAVSIQEIYRLYMPTEHDKRNDVAFYKDILRRVLEKCLYFLGDIGQQLTMYYVLPAKKRSYRQAKNAALFLGLISIVLWRLGVRKENYMLDVPFNVGQFLQLADTLHKEYCIQVRNKGQKDAALPMQLMGNEMLAIASERPVEGLNRLRDRMRIYLAWAKTTVGGDSGLVEQILMRFGEVSLKISSGDLPETFNDVEQAQVLIGYLATIPDEKKQNEEENSK